MFINIRVGVLLPTHGCHTVWTPGGCWDKSMCTGLSADHSQHFFSKHSMNINITYNGEELLCTLTLPSLWKKQKEVLALSADIIFTVHPFVPHLASPLEKPLLCAERPNNGSPLCLGMHALFHGLPIEIPVFAWPVFQSLGFSFLKGEGEGKRDSVSQLWAD